MRPDTQIRQLSRWRIGGYATVRGYRDLHGGFTDARSELLCMRYGKSECMPILNKTSIKGTPPFALGHIVAWHEDDIGLWVECQPFRVPAALMADLARGKLYYCLSTLPAESVCDLATGYFSRRACHLVNVTEYPTYRPSCWPDADAYLSHLIDTCGAVPDDVSADNEATPLHAALPEGLFTYGS